MNIQSSCHLSVLACVCVCVAMNIVINHLLVYFSTNIQSSHYLFVGVFHLSIFGSKFGVLYENISLRTYGAAVSFACVVSLGIYGAYVSFACVVFL